MAVVVASGKYMDAPVDKLSATNAAAVSAGPWFVNDRVRTQRLLPRLYTGTDCAKLNCPATDGPAG